MISRARCIFSSAKTCLEKNNVTQDYSSLLLLYYNICATSRTRERSRPLFASVIQSSATDFFLQCNGKRFNSFEETTCRVVFVAKATFDLPADSSPPHTPPAGSAVGAVATAANTAATTSGGGGISSLAGTPPQLCAARRFSPIGGGGSGAAAAAAAAAVGVGGGSSPEKAAAAAAVAQAAGWEYDASTCVICMERMESRVLTTVCNHSFHVECLMKWQDSPCPVCRFHHNNASEASTCQVNGRAE